MAVNVVTLLRGAPIEVWATRATGLLLPQGLIVLLIYSLGGLDLPLESLPLGLRIDPLHALMHVVWGAGGAIVGFARPQWSTPWLLVFGIYYVAVAMLGMFTELRFGMHFGIRDNTFHLVVGSGAIAVALYAALRNRGALAR
ncbi:MAG TPA: DUF4383 domain-containing protein [Bauldia sp.]|nr:DUF4383 domain-containing protein [Bauldia sp.]